MFPRLPARATFVADTNFVSGTQKLCLILFRNILCPQQMFPSLGNPRNIIGNNACVLVCQDLYIFSDFILIIFLTLTQALGSAELSFHQNAYLSTMFVFLTNSFFFADSLSWNVKEPTGVQRGSPAILEWAVSLSTEEKSRSDRFALIILEREMFLYSNLWQIMVVKQFSSGVHQEIGNDGAFDVIPENDMTLQLKNITDTDATRFRCTFLSSFAAPKSIVELEIKGEILLVRS